MRPVFNYILTLFCFSLLFVQGSAQEKNERVFSGRIVTADSTPVSGVTVEVQEQNRRTVSDATGAFSIVAGPSQILVFTKKGFTGIQKAAVDLVGASIVLQPSKVQGGDEDLVVIPFGSRTKRELTSAVSSFDADAVPHIPISNVTTLLSGRIPGLHIQQVSNGPGNDNTTLQVRGRSTYNTGNRPLVLVDGIVRDISDIDIGEIQSVTVLKDAASMAWYGLNAANGVVMFTTKKGSSRKMTINFDNQVGYQERTHIITPLSSFDYATLYNEALTNEGRPAFYGPDTLLAYRNNTNPYKFPSNNYVNSFLREKAPVTRHALSIGGGSNSFRYFTMVSYLRQEGHFTPVETEDFNSNLKFQRVNFRVNLDYDVNQNLAVGLNVGGRTGNLREPLEGASTILNDLYNLPPNAFPILNPDGTYGGTTIYRNNPMGRLLGRGYVRNLSRSIQANINARQKLNFITPGLSLNVLFSYDAQGNYQSGLTQDYEVFHYRETDTLKFRSATPLSYYPANFNNNIRRNEIWVGLDYDRSFSAHRVNASVRAMRSVDAAVERLDYRGQQVAGRVEYSFRDRYFAGFTGSYAGSENFAPGNRYGFFPAISAGWIISEEDFLNTNSFFNYAKLRASYGKTGNGDIGGSRLPFRTLYRAPAGFGYAFGTSFAATVSADPIGLGNPDITWEKLTRFNAGTDLVFLNRALTLSVDYFKDNRSDILTSPIVPGILGINLVGVNGGEVSSKGIETAVLFEQQLGQVSLSLNGNYTYAKNEVVAVNEAAGLLPYQSSIGYNTGLVSGTGSKLLYVSDGIFKDQAQIDNSPSQGTAIRPGDIKYKDINEDGVIDNNDRISTNFTDIPEAYFGFGFNLKYKIFELGTQFQGVEGRTIQVKGIVNSGPDGLNGFSLDRWTSGTASTAMFPRLAISSRANNNLDSDFWLRSGDFIKLRTVHFGISLPEKITQRARI
jgi:TonB-linked SusC/RagA family outer membrane protein